MTCLILKKFWIKPIFLKPSPFQVIPRSILIYPVEKALHSARIALIAF
jgi:hypothetical protein